MSKVLLDSHQSPFSERYKSLLIKAGVEVGDLSVPRSDKKSQYMFLRQMASLETCIVHFLWAYNTVPTLLIPRLTGKKVILHWIGSDVPLALHCPQVPWKLLGNCHLAIDVGLAQELHKICITADVIRAPCSFPDMALSWPTGYRVLTYLPSRSGDLYSSRETMQLAKELPWAEFWVTANDGQGMPPLPNVRYLGWLNQKQMDEAYSQCKVVLRLTKHDGGGGTAMEGLVRERYVVWTKPYPYSNYIRLPIDFLQLKLCISELLRREKPNIGSREIVLADFDNDKITRQLLHVYKELE